MEPIRRLFRNQYEHSPRVIDSPGGSLSIEEGRLEEYAGDRLAVVSSWASQPVMSKSLSEYLQELDRLGYRSLVVSTSEVEVPLKWPHGLPSSTVVARRQNLGYDFGSWATALHRLPQIRDAKYALLTNDSMVGPFGPLDHLIYEAENSDADIFGITESYQIIRHPQSFFLMFHQGALNEQPWRDFFDNVRPQKEKVAIIQAYELGLSRYCAREGYSWETLVTAYETRSGRENPTLDGWRDILNADVPFIKRNLLVDEDRPVTSSEMTAEIAYRYGEDVRQWLPEGYRLPRDRQREETVL